jgi:4-amino-4-deoxy-L-arabinose transferase-like glycosyltransferase
MACNADVRGASRARWADYDNSIGLFGAVTLTSITRVPFGEPPLVVILILVTMAIRVLVASIAGLGFDESYWVVLARVPSLSYIDDAPMAAWLVAASIRIAGAADPLMFRLPFIALFAGSTWLMFRLTERLFGSRAGLWAAIAFNLAPIFTLAQGMGIVPDGPLIFFLLAAANAVAVPLFAPMSPRTAALYWIAAGAMGGLAFLSKYHAAFLFLAVLTFLVSVPAQRRWLATPGPWLGGAMGAFVFSPVIIWNVQRGFSGLLFQAGWINPDSISLRSLATMVGGSALFLGWLIVPLAIDLARALWRGPAEERSWFIALLAVGPIGVFTLASLWTGPWPHWPMPGWLFAFPLLGAAAKSFEQRRPRLIRYGMATWAAILAIVVAAFSAQIESNWLSRVTPGLLRAGDPTLDLLDWTELRAAFADRGLLRSQSTVVAATRWFEAGKVSYALGAQVPVFCLCLVQQHYIGRANLYDPARFAGADMILVGTEEMLRTQIDVIGQHFENMTPLEPVILHRGGEPVETLAIYRGTGYKPY